MKKLLTTLLAIMMAVTMMNFVACDNSDAIFKGQYEAASEETRTEILSNAGDSSDDEAKAKGFLMKLKYEVKEKDENDSGKMEYTVKTVVNDNKPQMSMELEMKSALANLDGKAYYYNDALFLDYSSKVGSGENAIETQIKTKKSVEFDIGDLIDELGMMEMDLDLGDVNADIQGDNYYFGVCTTDEYYKVKITNKYESDTSKTESEAYFVFDRTSYVLIAVKMETKMTSNDGSASISYKLVPYSGKVETPKNANSDELKTPIF